MPDKLLTHEEFDEEVRKALEPEKQASGRDVFKSIMEKLKGKVPER